MQKNKPQTWRKKSLLALSGLALIVVLIYSNTFEASWHLDDHSNILDNRGLHISNLKEIEVVRDGQKKKLHQGNVFIIFDAWTSTNFELSWQQKPWYVFVRALVERGIYKFHTEKYYGELSDDCHSIYNNVKAYLNLFKF